MKMNTGVRRKKGLTFACAVAFVGAFASSAVLFAARAANAKYHRVSASACLVSGSTGWVTYTNSALSNGDTTKSIDLHCPVPDSDYLQHDAIAALYVHGRDNSAASGAAGAVMTAACITFYGSNSGSCGDFLSTSSTGTGMYGLQPSLSEWQDDLYAYDFAYVFVRLPANTGGTFAPSNFRGFFITN
jgi:hypothetical protein